MLIYNLHELPQNLYGRSGGKAKGLAELARAGLRIAKGFVIIGLESEADYTAATEHYSASGMKNVAVRSSATAEDGADFSGAGQYTTYLNVNSKEKFAKALRGCMDSLNNGTAAAYSSYFAGAKSPEMSVVVQEMVSAVCAGVAFSVDPVTGENNIVIEAVAGLGESLVSGQAAAERYVVKGGAGGFCIDESNKLLDIAMLSVITDGINRAVEYFKRPLDTEWAIDEKGVLYWLQARSVTATGDTAIDELDGCSDNESVFSNCNVGEMLPGAVTPLSISTSVLAIDYGLRKMLAIAGVIKSHDSLPETACVTNFSGHLFFNLSSIFKMTASVLGASIDQIEISICGRKIGSPMPPAKQRNIIVKLINGTKYAGFLFSAKKARKQIGKLADGFGIEYSADPAEFYNNIDRAMDSLNLSLLLHYKTSSHSGAMSGALTQIIESKLSEGEDAKEILAGLLESIDEIESVDILRSLRVLAKCIDADKPEAKGYGKKELTAYLTGNPSAEVKAAYEYFLHRHGHRAIREAELRSKSWRNDTDALADYILTVLNSGSFDGGAGRKDSGGAEQSIKAFLKGKKAKGVLRWLIRQTRQGVVNREYSKSKFIKIADEFKIAYSRLADDLVRLQALPDADLIYFLTHREIKRLIVDKDAALIKKALKRRRLLDEQRELKFDSVYIGKPVPVKVEDLKAECGAVLSGAPISKGQVSGKARVVRNVEDAGSLQKGEIMVACFTDIGWSPYYSIIGGLITEVGSALSHGAVVAREFALPLVVNVANATNLIKTGDYISLNANRGTVTILENS